MTIWGYSSFKKHASVRMPGSTPHSFSFPVVPVVELSTDIGYIQSL